MKFSVLDWNIQGTQYYTKTHFSKIKPVLNSMNIDVLCLQEGQDFRHEKNHLDKFKDFNHIFSRGNEDGVNVISTRFPILEYGEIISKSDKGKDMGNILRAKIKIGRKNIKIYNCHLSIDGVGPRERLQTLKEILIDAKSHKGGVIICGDMNTTIPAKGINRKTVQFFHNEKTQSMISDLDERYFFRRLANKYGYKDIIDIKKSTRCIDLFHWEIFKLKLDRFLVNGLIKIEESILSSNYISDHRSIYITCDV